MRDRQLLNQWGLCLGRMLPSVGDCWARPAANEPAGGGVAVTLAAEEAASNRLRPAWWPGPISGLQRAGPSPIGGLHDGAGGRVYKRRRRRRGRRWPRHHRFNGLGGFVNLRGKRRGLPFRTCPSRFQLPLLTPGPVPSDQ